MDIRLIRAKTLRETAARLIKQADKIEAEINPNKCKSMTDTGEPRVANYPCKGNAIICSHSEIGKTASKVMTTKKCNPKNCKYFTINEADVRH